MRTDTCNVCGATWDPDIQSHRQGSDCVARLADQIKKYDLLVLHLQESLGRMLETRDEVEVTAFENMAREVKEIHAAILALKGRVERLEVKKK